MSSSMHAHGENLVRSRVFAAPSADRAGDLRPLRERMSLTQDRMARILGVSVRTLSAVENGKSAPSPHVTRGTVELSRLLDALEGLMPRDLIGRWLESPNEGFGGRRPLELIEAGRVDELWRMIFSLEANAAS